MVGNDSRGRRSGRSGTTVRRRKIGPRWYSWLLFICVSSVTFSGVLYVLNGQVTPTKTAAPGIANVSDNHAEHEARKSGPETAAPPPEPQKLTEVPSLTAEQVGQAPPSAENPGPAQPSEAQKPREEPPSAENPGPAQPSEAQKPRVEPRPSAENPGPAQPSEAQKPREEPPSAENSGPAQPSEAQKPREEPRPSAENPGPAQPSEAQKPGEPVNAKSSTLEAVKPARVTNGFTLRELPQGVADKVGHQIWLNETNGERDAITSWNTDEEFASLGIGHFIWFPEGKTATFDQDFPRMLEFLRDHGAHLPLWLDKKPIPPCPWISRADFIKHFNSTEMTELREFLLDTVAGQTQFLVVRAQLSLNKILDSMPSGAERDHIIAQLSRIAAASQDLYPLIDYINFKGDGTDPHETALDKQTSARQGWGLKQVLLRMTGTTNEPKAVLAEFSEAAQFLLRERVRNIPANGAWEAGWLRRVDTYRRPIGNLEPRRTWTGPPRKGG